MEVSQVRVRQPMLESNEELPFGGQLSKTKLASLEDTVQSVL